MAPKIDGPPPYTPEVVSGDGHPRPRGANHDGLEQTCRELHTLGLGNEQTRYRDVYIAVMGCTGAGKSSFIGACSNQDVAVGHDLTSCTIDVEEYSFIYRDTYQIHLIDTPGFDDTNRSDTDILRDVAGWLGTAYQHNILLAGIVYLHRISDPRMGGSARRNLVMFKKLCGEECFSRIVLATTFWSMVSVELGEKRERELLENRDFWGYMSQKGATILRHDGQRESAIRVIEHILQRSQGREAIPLAIQRELVDQGVELNDTTAGQSLEEELRRQREKFEREIRIMEKEKEELLREKDEESARELEKLQQEHLQKLASRESSSAALRTNLEALQADMMQKLRALEQEVERKQTELGQKGSTRGGSEAQFDDRANLDELHAREDELERQRKGLFARVTSLYRKGSTWIDNNPKSAANMQKAGRIVGKIAMAAVAASHPIAGGLAANAFSGTSSAGGRAEGSFGPVGGKQTGDRHPNPSPAQSPPTSSPPPGYSNSFGQQQSQPVQSQPSAAPPNPGPHQKQTPTDRATRTQPIKGPNPLGLPLTGTIGVDIILDKFGEQAAWKLGTIWPGPNVWSRFQDASWPDDLGRFLKSRDEETGVWYWVRPFTGTVRGGVWQSWR